MQNAGEYISSLAACKNPKDLAGLLSCKDTKTGSMAAHRTTVSLRVTVVLWIVYMVPQAG
jgi:hypothetical protein